jgi:hypothetical protein
VESVLPNRNIQEPIVYPPLLPYALPLISLHLLCLPASTFPWTPAKLIIASLKMGWGNSQYYVKNEGIVSSEIFLGVQESTLCHRLVIR